MSARLHLYSVYDDHIRVFFAFGFDCDLAGEGEGAAGLEDEGRGLQLDWLGVGLPHVDVEAHLLEGEVLGLSDEEFPDVLLFSFGEDGLFGG